MNDDDDADLIMLMEVLLDHESFHRSLAAGAQIYQLPPPLPSTIFIALTTVRNALNASNTHKKTCTDTHVNTYK